jgi:predicted SAM-dependent methyltransferase
VVNSKAPRAPEVLHALTFNADGSIVEQTPLPDEYADVLMAAHVVEHFREYEAPFVMQEWKRLLKRGGKLILELPNIEAAARNLLAGMDVQMWQFPFYGDGSHKDPYMLHPFGYTPNTIRRLVESAGFESVQLLPPQTHGPRPNRDMRVEALKPNGS